MPGRTSSPSGGTSAGGISRTSFALVILAPLLRSRHPACVWSALLRYHALATLPRQRQSYGAVGELGGKLGVGAHAVVGRQLRQVEADDPAAAGDGGKHAGHVPPGEAARLWSADGG